VNPQLTGTNAKEKNTFKLHHEKDKKNEKKGGGGMRGGGQEDNNIKGERTRGVDARGVSPDNTNENILLSVSEDHTPEGENDQTRWVK